MPSTPKEYAIALVRVILVAGGFLVASLTIYHLATMPPAPPDSDGFVTGLAFLFGSIIFVLALGVASLGVILPTVLGLDDPIGFNRGQRLLLRVGAVLIGGGFFLGVVYGLATELQYGFFLWLGTIVLSVLVVVLAVAWRAIEACWTAIVRLAGPT